MSDYWIIPRNRVRSALVLATALLSAWAATGCELRPDAAEYLEAATPMADVEIFPELFCPGEILTVTWDGGPQLPDCPRLALDVLFDERDRAEVLSQCKVGHLYGTIALDGVGNTSWDRTSAARSLVYYNTQAKGSIGVQSFYLQGSAQGAVPLDHYSPVWFFFTVQWDGWDVNRNLRNAIVPQTGPDRSWYITGVVKDYAVARPYHAGIWATANHTLECVDGRWQASWEDEYTLDYTYARQRGEPDELVYDTTLSACTSSGEICVTNPGVNVTLSVPGGPEESIGGDNPHQCTAAFGGYHPQDIQMSLGPCTPGEAPPIDATYPLVSHQLANNGICPNLGGHPLTRELQGVSLDRCLAALDPDASGIVPISDEIDLDEQCGLSASCGDGTCSLLCEDAETCAVDCGPGVCGDGTLSPDEECETSDDCQGGLVCGAPDTDDACTCVPATVDLPPVAHPDIVPAGVTCEDFPVYDCVKSEFGYTWYTGRRCYDADGNVTFDGQVGGPFSSAEWQPFCPGAGGGGGDEGGGGGGGYCGDGICQASESACGACSADCGPC